MILCLVLLILIQLIIVQYQYRFRYLPCLTILFGLVLLDNGNSGHEFYELLQQLKDY